MYDVLVVGAGPAGSLSAYLLAQGGHKVLVVEQQDSIGEEVCCTGLVGKECVHQFPICASTIIRPASSAVVFSPSGRELRIEKDTPQAFIIDRAAFDRALASTAKAAGAEYLLGTRLKDISVGEEGVVALLAHNDHSTELRARVAIIAAGSGSTLPQKLGLGHIGDFVIGAQARVERNGVNKVEVYLGQKTAPGFFAWLVPTTPGKALVGLLSRRSPRSRLKKLLSELSVEGKIASADVPLTQRAIPLTPLPRTYGERVVVVGDAAGQAKPTTGGGVYYGLLCAQIAADTVHRALESNDFSAKHFAHYERDWRKKLFQELRVGYQARRVYEMLSDRQIEHVLRFIDSSGIHHALLNAADFSFDRHANLILSALKYQALPQALRAVRNTLLSLIRG